MSKLSSGVVENIASTVAGASLNGYMQHVVEDEFIGVEMQRNVVDRATRIVIALRPPRPFSTFAVSDVAVEHTPTQVMADLVMSDIRKHASELRWNCIETMLRADIEANRLDRMRMVQFLEQTLDNETREWLATKLMERVEVVPR